MPLIELISPLTNLNWLPSKQVAREELMKAIEKLTAESQRAQQAEADAAQVPNFTQTSICGEFAGSIKITTHLVHISHY